MALQIYAAMSSDSDVSISTLTLSILFSLASVSFTVIRYTIKLSQTTNPVNPHHESSENGEGSVKRGSISKLVSKIKNAKPEKTPSMILEFVISDFLIRSVPVCSETK